MATRDVRLPGKAEKREGDTATGVEDFLDDVEVQASYEIKAPTRGATDEPQEEKGLPDDAVVEIEYEDGVKEWVSVERLAERLGVPPGYPLTLEAIVPGDADRGLGDWLVTGVRIFTGRGAKKAAPHVVRKAIAKVEDKLGEPDLYRVPGTFENDKLVLEPRGKLDADEPYLLLLHGTASSTEGSFRGLFLTDDRKPTREWANLERHFGGRVLALEHKTLSVSPIENAIDALEALPRQARLHVVSHSRGGLVGDLLTLDQIPETAQQAYVAKRRRLAERNGLPAPFVKREAELLAKLAAKLNERDVHVERYVRVACPARGTRLAGNRLDKLLSILTNLVGMIPLGGFGNVLLGFVKALTVEVARLRADPESLPGIEAMMPKSPFVHLLNLPEVSTEDDLAVISGDIEGRDVLHRLAVWASDIFFGVPHDLVVNTDAMSEGVRRKGTPVVFPHRGSKVNHFAYFRGAESRKHLAQWLTKAPDKQVEGAEPLVQTRGSAGLTTPKTRSTAEDVPRVVLVPTALATHLGGDSPLWLDADAILRQGLAPLAMNGPAGDGEATPITVNSVFETPYQPLVERLSADFAVRAYPYDWRQPLTRSADGLLAILATQLGHGDGPVHIVAHGTGGLVFWLALARDPSIWQQLADRKSRIVLVGVPDRGAHGILQLLRGGGVLFDQLDTLLTEEGLTRDGLAARFRHMPGLVALLPGDRKAWTGWLGDDLADLDEIEGIRQQIAAAVAERGPEVLRIAGRATFTPSGIADGRWAHSSDGDGLALDTAQALGNRAWWAAVANGDLPRRDEVGRAVRDLLLDGTSTALPQSAPHARPAPDARPPWEVTSLFPTGQDLVTAAVFARPPQTADRSPERHVLNVSVSHGSLERAAGPVLIGHYRGDLIVAAEAVLDRELGGRLSSRHQLGVYPEEVGEHEVVLTPPADVRAGVVPGAIVIGLGDVGKLTPADLTRGVTQAALRYAIEHLEHLGGQIRSDTWLPATISPLLVGSNSGMALTLETSIGAIVKGIVLANRALRDLGFWDRVRIHRVEFIELYLDLATRAAHAVADIDRHLRLPKAKGEEVRGGLWLENKGGRPGQPSLEYHTGWTRRLQITAGDDEATAREPEDGDGGPSPQTIDLKFLALTDRARAEETNRSTQRKIIDKLVAGTIEGRAEGNLISGVLFELLLPNTLKEQSNEPANLQLVLDSRAAAFPWEMLTDRADLSNQPLAVQQGILRQLTTRRFRRRIESPRGRHALVVGDPNLEGMKGYRQLPGALFEAQQVKDTLERAGYTVNAVVDDAVEQRSGDEVFLRLFDRQREYSIVHIAAHGQYDRGNVHNSGVVVGDGQFLTAAEISQLRVVPELVFLNCCHLARMDDPTLDADERAEALARGSDFSRFAASISEQLIEIGVGAVVAAGWAVDDRAAADFATVFYERITRGDNLAEAALAARQAAWEHGGTTWGAYQVYGSPDFRLYKESAAAARQQRRIVAEHEFEAALRELQTRAQGASESARIDELSAEVDQLVAEMRPEWSSGSVLDALGGCLGELRRFDEAIGFYTRARDSWDKRAPLEVLDEMYNLVARAAVDRVDGPDIDPQAVAEAGAACEDAIEKVRGLLVAAPSPERWALLGSIQKRLARIVDTVDGRNEQLAGALASYVRAHEDYVAKRSDSSNMPAMWPRYAWNVIVLRWLLDLVGHEIDPKERDKASGVSLDTLGKAAESLRGSSVQDAYWTNLVSADIAMMQALESGDIASHVEELADRYRAIAGGTPKMRSSPVEQLAFMEQMLAGHDEDGVADMREALASLRHKLS